jgi:hypothetical protein
MPNFFIYLCSMRSLGHLLAFYVLLLTVIPCNPQDNCCNEEITASSRSGLPTNSKPEFPCSPFFACGANHGIVIPEVEIQVYQLRHHTEKRIAQNTEKPSFLSRPSVWQPPKAV